MNKENSKHIPVLDGIRAYAVLMVCVVHFFQVDESSLYEANKIVGVLLFKLTQIGLKGVELFFLLSGFLITSILLESKTSAQYFSTFYARRFIRIFPLFYFVLIISFWIIPNIIIVDVAGQYVINNQIWLWTYTSNTGGSVIHGAWDASRNFPSFGHFWSLCVEEQFYVFWPVLIYIFNLKQLPYVMWSIVFISILSVILSFNSIQPNIFILKWGSISSFGVLALGGLIAYYKKYNSKYELIINLSKKYVIPLGVLFIIVNFIPRQYIIRDISTLLVSVLFFSVIIILSLNRDKIFQKIFNHKYLFFIGKISYGIYIYHGMLRPYFKEYIYKNLHIYVQNGIIASTLYTILCTVISILIAWISWQIIEQPILKLKKHFKY